MENNQNSQIRFSGFSEKWKQLKMGDIGSISMCKRIFKSQTTPNGEIPFYKIGTFGRVPDSFISRQLFEEFRYKYPYPEVGDVLISASGTIGRTVVYNGEEAYFQDSNIVWLKRKKELVDNTFLEQFYQIVKWAGTEGSTIKRLYNNNILSTEIFLPPIKEQIKIGDFFKRIDKTISLQQQELDTLNQTKQGFLQKMFPKEGETTPEVRFPGFNDEWEETEFKHLAKIRRGLTYKPTDVEPTGVRVLRSSNVKDDVFTLRNDDVFVNPNAINIEYVKEDDILITSANGSSKLVGKHALIKNVEDATVHGGFMLIASAQFPYFVNALMSSSWYDKFIHVNVSGGNGAIGNLNKNDLENYNVLAPSLNEQAEIGDFFKQLDELIALQQQELDALKQTKKAFLQKMFV